MRSDIELAIQGHLLRYLNGDTSLNEFEDWFVPVLWDLGECDDHGARNFAGGINNLIAEASKSGQTQAWLREELKQLLSLSSSQVRSGPFVVAKTQNLSLSFGVRRRGPSIVESKIPIPGLVREQTLQYLA